MYPKLTLTAAALVVAGATAEAATITKALDTSDFGWNSNIADGDQQSTDDVILKQDGVATALSWYGFGNGVDTANFTEFAVRFFVDITERAVTNFFYEDIVTVTGVDTGIQQSGNDIFYYTVDIKDILLKGGVRYDMSIAAISSDRWTWNFSAPETDDQFHRNGDDDAWREISRLGHASHAYTLTFDPVSAVPVPAGLPLLLAGLGVMGWLGRRTQG